MLKCATILHIYLAFPNLLRVWLAIYYYIMLYLNYWITDFDNGSLVWVNTHHLPSISKSCWSFRGTNLPFGYQVLLVATWAPNLALPRQCTMKLLKETPVEQDAISNLKADQRWISLKSLNNVGTFFFQGTQVGQRFYCYEMCSMIGMCAHSNIQKCQFSKWHSLVTISRAK